MAQQKVYDAILIGSGASGGMAAKELTRKGLEVLVLEAGLLAPGRTTHKSVRAGWATI